MWGLIGEQIGPNFPNPKLPNLLGISLQSAKLKLSFKRNDEDSTGVIAKQNRPDSPKFPRAGLWWEIQNSLQSAKFSHSRKPRRHRVIERPDTPKVPKVFCESIPEPPLPYPVPRELRNFHQSAKFYDSIQMTNTQGAWQTNWISKILLQMWASSSMKSDSFEFLYRDPIFVIQEKLRRSH